MRAGRERGLRSESPTAARIQGLDVHAIADEFGTPLYVYDGDVLRAGYQDLRKRLHPAIDIFYSLKANPNVSVCAILGSLGAGAEVSSMVELETAARAGVSPSDVIFLGPGKTADDLRICLERDIRAVVCESVAEMEALGRLAAGRSIRVLLRVNPAFETKGSGLAMGGKPRQFGIDEDQIGDAVEVARRFASLRLMGFHAYMGTRFLRAADIAHNTRGILDMATELAQRWKVPLRVVDIGGGLGVPYFDNEEPLDLDATATGVNAAVDRFREDHPACRIILETGRFLAAPCGTYVTRALYVKESSGHRFVVADGGTNHHMAAVGIGSFVKRNFPITSLTANGVAADRSYTITGPLCTPNDVLAKAVSLPEVRPGDLIGVARSGAYGPSASPGLFLSHGHPAEVLVDHGTAHLVRRRDTAADLMDKQVLIPVRPVRDRSDTKQSTPETETKEQP